MAKGILMVKHLWTPCEKWALKNFETWNFGNFLLTFYQPVFHLSGEIIVCNPNRWAFIVVGKKDKSEFYFVIFTLTHSRKKFEAIAELSKTVLLLIVKLFHDLRN